MTEKLDLGTLRVGVRVEGKAQLRELKEAKITTVQGEVVAAAHGGTYMYIKELDAYYTPDKAGFVASDWKEVTGDGSVGSAGDSDGGAGDGAAAEAHVAGVKPEKKAAPKKPAAKKAAPKKVEPKGAAGA